ncbi:MAG TPA: Mur ligase family protein [Thermomicrobiales bacterium]|nr:Mur ligase family protein [Thermomicrobiales bacterium]
MSAPVNDYTNAERYVNGLIMGPPSPAPGTPPEEIRARAIARLARLRAFLEFLGNPQRQYETVHVAGTSGKGSTCAFTASILSGLGLRTGLHVSPYLQVATEKLQIDGKLVDASRYARLVSDMTTSVEHWVALGNERPNYGEFWVAMTYRYFAEELVDVAVIEVGAGGRFDVTNVIEPRVAAITSIGLDHVTTLGATLTEIAWHKAGIIKPGCVVVTAVSGADAYPVIEAECREQGVPLISVRENEAFSDVDTDESGTSFEDAASARRMHVRLPGTFQASNAATALAIARAYCPVDPDPRLLTEGLASARFPGRMEIVQNRPTVILDGAHNPEKIQSLRNSLDLMFPKRRRILVFGALEAKSYLEMFEIVSPGSRAVFVTEPRVLSKPATKATAYASLGRLAPIVIEPDPRRALEQALSLAGRDDLVIVTGSLYLVGNVRERWFSVESILEQGTSWPVVIDRAR